MPTIADLVPLVLLPAVLVLIVRGLVALSRGRSSAAARDAAVSLAIAVAFCVVLYLREIRPQLPLASSESPWEWVFWLVPAAAVVGVVETATPMPRLVRLAVRLVVGAGAAWLVVARVPGLAGAGRLARVAVAAVAVASLWTAIAFARDPERRRAVAVSTVVAVGAGGAVVGVLATTVGMAEALACLAAGAGAAAVPIPFRGPLRIPTAAAATIAVGLVLVLLSAYSFLNYGDVVNVPLGTVVLLAIAPATGWLVPRRSPPIIAILLAGAAALLVVGAAAAIGGAFAPKATAGY
jgi:hypothetical protein